MALEKIIQFLGRLIAEGFTGRIILDFHRGELSPKIRKEIVEEVK
jgi:hypothetical protein